LAAWGRAAAACSLLLLDGDMSIKFCIARLNPCVNLVEHPSVLVLILMECRKVVADIVNKKQKRHVLLHMLLLTLALCPYTTLSAQGLAQLSKILSAKMHKAPQPMGCVQDQHTQCKGCTNTT
jgi:hypothetical protein